MTVLSDLCFQRMQDGAPSAKLAYTSLAIG
jgi:hypothetical protein